MEDTNIVFSSYSQIEKYLQCPYSWFLKYVEGIKDETKSEYLEYGLAVHETLEVYFKYKKKYNKVMPLDKILETYNRHFIKHNIPFEQPESEIEALIEGKITLERLYNPSNDLEKLFEKAKILGVETPFEIVIDGITIKGFIDLILGLDDKIYLIDHKSGGKLFDKSKLQTNLQFPIYAIAIKNMFNKLPDKCFYNFTKLHKFQEVIVDDDRINKSVEEIKKVFKKMLNKKYNPKPCPLCYWCDFGLYKLNICQYSSDWRPKQK